MSHDLVFYERWWNGEVQIALGLRNKVRNELKVNLCCTQNKLFFKAETREFLMHWSKEDNNDYVPTTPNVFYGTENGLLHILLIKWFVLKTFLYTNSK